MIKFKDIFEAKIYNIRPDGTKEIKDICAFSPVLTTLQKCQGYSSVVDVSDLFHETYKKSDNYISMSGKGKRDERSNKWIRNLLTNGTVLQMPIVEICDQGSIKFKDGAHRYGMLHRLKLNKQVAMTPESFQNAKKFKYVK